MSGSEVLYQAGKLLSEQAVVLVWKPQVGYLRARIAAIVGDQVRLQPLDGEAAYVLHYSQLVWEVERSDRTPRTDGEISPL